MWEYDLIQLVMNVGGGQAEEGVRTLEAMQQQKLSMSRDLQVDQGGE